jgi:hypothetical protein
MRASERARGSEDLSLLSVTQPGQTIWEYGFQIAIFETGNRQSTNGNRVASVGFAAPARAGCAFIGSVSNTVELIHLNQPNPLNLKVSIRIYLVVVCQNFVGSQDQVAIGHTPFLSRGGRRRISEAERIGQIFLSPLLFAASLGLSQRNRRKLLTYNFYLAALVAHPDI